MCIPEGILRARLDGELKPEYMREVDAHLAGCARCAAKAGELERRADRVGTLLNGLEPAEAPADPGFALARMRARQEGRMQKQTVWTRIFAKRWAPAWGAALALAIAFSFFSGPTTAMAQKILGLFRAKTVVAVPVNFKMASEGDGKMLEQLMSSSVTVDKNEPARPAADRKEAAALAGFTVRMPSLRQDAPHFTVRGEQQSHFTADVERVKKVLELVNRPDLQLPAGIDGAKVSVTMARGVHMLYGDCEKGPALRDCVIVDQTPVPTVVTLPELNLKEVAELGLQLAGMTEQEAKDFSASVDWTSTLAIPIPVDAANSESVAVDGVRGILIHSRQRGERPGASVVVWIKDGMVYTVSAVGNPSQALPLANSMS